MHDMAKSLPGFLLLTHANHTITRAKTVKTAIDQFRYHFNEGFSYSNSV